MSKRVFYRLFSDNCKTKLSKCKIKLRIYGGHRVPVIGGAKVKVECEGITKMLAKASPRC